MASFFSGCSSIHSYSGGTRVHFRTRFIGLYGQMLRCIIKSPCCPVSTCTYPVLLHEDSHQVFRRYVLVLWVYFARSLCLLIHINTCTDGIAVSITIGVINYVLLGFEFPVDGFYMHSFEIWLATTIVFFGSGNVGFTLLEYRLGEKNLVSSIAFVVVINLSLTWAGLQLSALWENLMWIPFLWALFLQFFPRSSLNGIYYYSFFFFGGLSIPMSQAILAHLFSYNISWQATKKEVERSNFFKEVPKIFRRFADRALAFLWFFADFRVVRIDSGSRCWYLPLLLPGWSSSARRSCLLSGV